MMKEQRYKIHRKIYKNLPLIKANYYKHNNQLNNNNKLQKEKILKENFIKMFRI